MVHPFTRGVQFASFTLRASAFSVVSTLVAPILLIWLDQGRELLNMITDEHARQDEGPFTLFLLALLAWGLANWYCSRLLVQRELKAWQSISDGALPFVNYWAVRFPRALGVIGISVIGVYVAVRGELLAAAWVCLTLIVFIAIVAARRWLFGMQPVEADHETKLRNGDRIALWLTLAMGLVLLVGLTDANVGLARSLGGPVILFLGLATIVMFGSIVLTFMPMSYGWPSLVWVPVLAVVTFAALGLNRNHGVVHRQVKGSDRGCDPRPDVVDHFSRWLAAHPDEPIFLVAAEGGASRSAWWTAHVLSTLDHRTNGRFSNSVYAISGVSGGSLGAAAYVALLAQRGSSAPQSAPGQAQLAPPTPTDCRRMRAHRSEYPLPMQSECFLGGDFLSTTLGYLIFPDTLQRMLPFPVPSWDRSLGLEKAWEADWSYLFGASQVGTNPPRNMFAEPLDRLYRINDGPVRTDLPLLLLNTARAKAGRSVLQAPVRIKSSELDDLFDGRLRTRGLPLSALVHNSARFPLVSPGGDIQTWDGGHWDAVVDGGYFENSGAATLAELIRSIRSAADEGQGVAAAEEKQCVADEKKESAAGEKNAAELRKALERIHVLFIMNDPSSTRPIVEPDQPDPQYRSQPVIRQEELVTPLVGLFNSRSARGDSSKRFLLDLLPKRDDGSKRFTEIFLAEGFCNDPKSGCAGTTRPAMTWYLNRDSRLAMWSAVDKGRNPQAVCSIAAAVGASCTREDEATVSQAGGTE